jgi:hypothetical protein
MSAVLNNAVAQEMLGIDHDAQFLALARRLLGHLFPKQPQPPGYCKRRQRLSDTIEWLISSFAADRPGLRDNVVLLDSTPVQCGRSVEVGRPGPGPRAQRILAPADQKHATSRCGRCRSGCTTAK